MKKYAETHECVRIEDPIAIMGISEGAADELGDVEQVTFPEVGSEVKKGEIFLCLESIKATQDVYAPVSGVIVEVNSALADTPELINDDAEGEGWIIKIKMSDATELDSLLDQDPW